jgi:hypothetical protein
MICILKLTEPLSDRGKYYDLVIFDDRQVWGMWRRISIRI